MNLAHRAMALTPQINVQIKVSKVYYIY